MRFMTQVNINFSYKMTISVYINFLRRHDQLVNDDFPTQCIDILDVERSSMEQLRQNTQLGILLCAVAKVT